MACPPRQRRGMGAEQCFEPASFPATGFHSAPGNPVWEGACFTICLAADGRHACREGAEGIPASALLGRLFSVSPAVCSWQETNEHLRCVGQCQVDLALNSECPSVDTTEGAKFPGLVPRLNQLVTYRGVPGK